MRIFYYISWFNLGTFNFESLLLWFSCFNIYFSTFQQPTDAPKCAIYAINNLLQCPLFSEELFIKIAGKLVKYNLARHFACTMVKLPKVSFVAIVSVQRFQKNFYSSSMGFSIAVPLSALCIFPTVIPHRLKPKDLDSVDFHQIDGVFICMLDEEASGGNLHMHHCVAIRRHLDQFCLLDSLLPANQGGRVRVNIDDIKRMARKVFNTKNFKDTDKHVVTFAGLPSKEFLAENNSPEKLEILMIEDAFIKVADMFNK